MVSAFPFGLPHVQRALVAQSWPWPVLGMESSGGSCSLPFRNEVAAFKLFSLSDTTTRAPLLAAPALLDARGFRSPPPVESPVVGFVRDLSCGGLVPRKFPWGSIARPMGVE